MQYATEYNAKGGNACRRELKRRNPITRWQWEKQLQKHSPK